MGRMLALAAHRLGLNSHVFCPDPQSPAFAVTPHKTVAGYDDRDALKAFAGQVDRITYEFENVPVQTARLLAEFAPVFPDDRALEVAQDRLTEKNFIASLDLTVAPFSDIAGPADAGPAIKRTGLPAILKTRRLGYDGKGQKRVETPAQLHEAIAVLGDTPAILEGFVKFGSELSVILARSADGTIRAYDPATNVHRNHILSTSTVPASVSGEVATEAIAMASRIAEALSYVGVLGVEFFVEADRLTINEIAPRVHNSGHWTEAACTISQFEMHVRAVAGWPLPEPYRHSDAVLENLIGDDIEMVPELTAPGVQVHHYGKGESRPGRKMGHLTRITPRSTAETP